MSSSVGPPPSDPLWDAPTVPLRGADPLPYKPPSPPPPPPPPQSPRSRITTGTLQLAGMLGIVGFGRLYIGHYLTAFSQFSLAFVGGVTLGHWLSPIAAMALVPGVVGATDAALIFSGQVEDREGRPLQG